MRKVLATVAAVVMAGGIAWASHIPFYTGPMEAGNLVGILNNLIGQINSSTGFVAAQPGPVNSTATTSEQTFATTVLPGGTLSLPGQTLVIRCAGKTATNGNTKTANLYFGSFEYSTAAMSTSGESWELELTVTAVSSGANSVIYGRGSSGSVVVAPVATNNTTDNLAAGITAKCTGTQGSASAADMTMENFVIWQEK